MDTHQPNPLPRETEKELQKILMAAKKRRSQHNWGEIA
jgi:hypothetical protein